MYVAKRDSIVFLKVKYEELVSICQGKYSYINQTFSIK